MLALLRRRKKVNNRIPRIDIILDGPTDRLLKEEGLVN